MFAPFSVKLLRWLSASYSKSLRHTPLERPGVPGRNVQDPVCEYVEARWLSVVRLVPQFSDGITMELGLTGLPRLSQRDLLPGDVLICCPPGREVQGVDVVDDKLSGGVRLFTRGVFTHAAIIGRDGRVYEAALPCVQITPFEEWLKSFRYVVILRHSGMAQDEERSAKVCDFLERSVRHGYNVPRAVEMMLIGGALRPNLVTLMTRAVVIAIEGTLYRGCHVCSTLVWSALAAGGVTFEGDPLGRHVTPAMFIDRALLEPVGYATASERIEPHRLDVLGSSYIS